MPLQSFRIGEVLRRYIQLKINRERIALSLLIFGTDSHNETPPSCDKLKNQQCQSPSFGTGTAGGRSDRTLNPVLRQINFAKTTHLRKTIQSSRIGEVLRRYIQLKINRERIALSLLIFGRSDRTRTCSILLPNKEIPIFTSF